MALKVRLLQFYYMALPLNQLFSEMINEMDKGFNFMSH